METLNSNTTLHSVNGKYKIDEILGQNDFGITYLALDDKNVKVVVKEFFIKSLCERDSQSNNIILRDKEKANKVKEFLDKFLSEAYDIKALNQAGMLCILDIFEENNTAYYIIEYEDDCTYNDILFAYSIASTRLEMTSEQITELVNSVIKKDNEVAKEEVVDEKEEKKEEEKESITPHVIEENTIPQVAEEPKQEVCDEIAKNKDNQNNEHTNIASNKNTTNQNAFRKRLIIFTICFIATIVLLPFVSNIISAIDNSVEEQTSLSSKETIVSDTIETVEESSENEIQNNNDDEESNKTSNDEIVENEDNVNNKEDRAIDLGLSVLWSDRYIGASSQYEMGDLYAWGNSSTTISKKLNSCPCKNPPRSLKNTSYDVARNAWGGKWRMPTLIELKELKLECEWTIENYDGTYYCKVTGPNGNSIFLALSGFHDGTKIKKRNEWGFIWSADIYSTNESFASNLSFSKTGKVETSGYFRYGGENIRPVMDK